VPRGDWSAFKKKIAQVLKKQKPIHTHEKIRKVAKFEEYAKRMDHIVTITASREIPEELLKFKWTRRFKPGRQLRQPVNNKHEIKADRFLKPVSRFMKNHLSYHKYERLKDIYKEYKSKKKSALKTMAAFISLFTGKKKKYPGSE
jgi:hypothetical protein